MIAKDLKFYSDNKEDRFLYEYFKLPDKGVFVDVGAGNGINGSNTYFFERNGWTGICIDADPRNTKILRKNRKVGISALVSNKKGKLTFYMNDETPDISGIRKTIEHPSGRVMPTNAVWSIKLKAVTLEKILIDNHIGEIDLLSIDTEGSELDVFKSMDFEKHLPKILVIEYITQDIYNLGVKPFFEKRGYYTIADAGSNQIFVLRKP